MKPFLIFLSIILLSFTLSAQTVQRGIVKEYNEKAQKTPLAGVELKIRSANSTVSDRSGNFSLEFLTLKPGERVNVRAIEKLGYEIFNKEAIEQWNINPKEPFVIVMCRSDRFKKIRDNYEKVASASYAKQLKKETAALERLKAEGKLKEDEYRRQLRELQENFDRQLDHLDNYIDRFSRIDLSEISATDQEIIELVQQGDIETAIAKCADLKITEKLINEIDERKRIREAKEKLAERENFKTISIDSLYAIQQRQIDILMMMGGSENIKKVASIYREVTDVDSLNFEWLIRAGSFVADYLCDYESAIYYNQLACNGIIGRYGEIHPLTAVCYNNLGSVYDMVGDHDKALLNKSKASIILEASFGNDSEIFATSVNNIAYTYDKLGNKDIALKYYEKALEIKRNLYGSENPELANIYSNIGSVYLSLGDFDKALEYMQKTVDIHEKTNGNEHIETANAYNNLGAVYSKAKDVHEALDLYEKALRIRLKTYGENHLLVADSYVNIGLMYKELKDFDSSIKCYEKALGIREGLLGPNHEEVVDILYGLGMSYCLNDEFEKALEYFEKLLQINLDVHGSDHKSVEDSYDCISMVYDQQGMTYSKAGEYDSALNCFNRALESNLKAFGAGHTRVLGSYDIIALTHNQKGMSYSKAEEYDKALECFRQALEVNLEAFGPDHESVSDSYTNIALTHNHKGMAYFKAEEYDKALECFRQALEVNLEVFGPDHEYVADSYEMIAMIYDKAEEYEKVLENYSKSLSVRENLGNTQTDYELKTIDLLCAMAACCKIIGNYSTAVGYYSRALTKATVMTDVEFVAGIYYRLSDIYYLLSDYEKALANFDESLSLMLTLYSPDHEYLISMYEDIVSIYRKLNDYENVLKYCRKFAEYSSPDNIEKLKDCFLLCISIGDQYYELLDNDRAFDCFKETYDLMEQKSIEDQSVFNEVYQELGSAFEKLGELEYADKCNGILSRLSSGAEK